MDGNVAAVLVAAVTALPASVGALLARNANKKLKMKNGTAIGARVEQIHEEQQLVALALMGAQAKVDSVALALKDTEAKREEDRRAVAEQAAVITSHLGDDKKFQEAAERFWAPLVPLLAQLQPKVEGN